MSGSIESSEAVKRAEEAARPESLVVVSNRQPYSHDRQGDEISVDEPAGGLTAGLDPVMQTTDGTWIAWGDGAADECVTDEKGRVRVPPDDPSYTLRRLWLTERDVERYYAGYSNQVLWPVCHGANWKVEHAETYFDRYREVNERFAEAVVDAADEGTTVWFQDYHLALAPRRVTGQRDSFCMQFWHIPWPSWDGYRRLPQREELLDGLLSNDLLGFHLPSYAERFLDCAERALGATVDRGSDRVWYRGEETTVGAFPLGVDAERRHERALTVGDEFWTSFRKEHGIGPDEQVVVGVDRLDYTKGIPERLAALERLFERHPERRGRLTYVQKAAESRTSIPAYRRLGRTVRDEVDRINHRFGTADWKPIVHVEEYLDEREIAGLYRHADCALVSPVCDGMNLVAMEYVASQVDSPGVLVLSELAGAHELLGDHAVSINPYATEAFADAIDYALEMDVWERRERMDALRRVVFENDLEGWMNDIFRAAATIRG
ncbi:alpha,alpha-trehalose-phosphate synthase (UDP-forming) [Natronorarus salvus]|uniref:alpha,alpha-trehalose-phosphate synthase (UDP-forming) n=1 Tax=Natronorarus salvus TaxID=3117733 RepID=UPI002F2665D5